MYRVLRHGRIGVISDVRNDASLAEIDQEVRGMGWAPLTPLTRTSSSRPRSVFMAKI
jgi:hypothetical protein